MEPTGLRGSLGGSDHNRQAMREARPMPGISTDVLVVGAGPCGLVAGLTAARYGVNVHVVEQRAGGSSLSRALVISTRGMELMRRFGIEDAVRAGAPDVSPTALVTPTLTSADGTVMPLGYPSDEEALEVSPTRPAWAPQFHHEPLLLAQLRSEPTATVSFDTRLVALGHDGDRCQATVVDVPSGEESSIEARYIVAADGAHSAVRAAVDIDMDGPDDLMDYERVEFGASLDAAVGGRAHALYVLVHPDLGGAVLARRGRGNLWGLSRERPLGQPGFEQLSSAELLALIRTGAGVADLEITVERINRFAFAAQIAERYRDRNVFLVGDAAHRMTPRGGTGMNTGIQDAFDIAWKLGWVLSDWSSPALLDSYEAERRPIGLHNVGRSADPGGARRPAEEALPWDLNGRLTHAWLERDGARVSTIDLIGDGLTVLAAADDPRWPSAAAGTGLNAPVRVEVVDGAAAAALDLGPAGAVLVRPDGHEVVRWGEPESVPILRVAGLGE